MAAVAREQRPSIYELAEEIQIWKLRENEHLPGRIVDT